MRPRPLIEPVGGPLSLPQAGIEQDPHTVSREAPGDEDAISRALGPNRQVGRVHEQRQEPDLAEARARKAAVAIAQLAADRNHARLGQDATHR